MARTQHHPAESQPGAPSGGSPPRRPGDSDAETSAPPGSRPEGGALFGVLMAAGVDPGAAYTAVREMESMAGRSVVAELGGQIRSFASEVRSDLQKLETRLSGVESRLTEVRSDVAVLKREVRLIWGVMSLLVVTLTAVLIRLFAS